MSYLVHLHGFGVFLSSVVRFSRSVIELTWRIGDPILRLVKSMGAAPVTIEGHTHNDS